MVDASKVVGQLLAARQRHNAPLILELDLTEGIVEGPPTDPIAAIQAMRRTRLSDIVEGLRRAARDPKVIALVAKVGGGRIALAQLQEIRDAVKHFGAAGKPTVAWAESFGELGGGTLPYYLATAFGRIHLQPSGDVGLTGVAIEERFLHDTLQKAGVDYQLTQRHEYKTAANTFTQTGYTEPHREASGRLAESIAEQVVVGVAEGRGLPEDGVRRLVDEGPYTAAEALEHGLVDELSYRDEVYGGLRKRFGDQVRLQYVGRYQRSAGNLAKRLPHPGEQVVALIHATGPIVLGRSHRTPFSGPVMGADTVAAALRAARRDDRVKAIVLRVDSPGGSYTASDTIWREVGQARAAGKPVVVSMGVVAASGGYFVSMGADAIVAQPGTLTGSIGVLGGKPVITELLGRIGVGTDSVQEGANARMFSTSLGFTEAEWARLNGWMDRVYEDFTGKVAAGRGMTRERAHELARGRVWTGADAVANGLVDELGGVERAADEARKRAGLPADAPLRSYPKTGPLERLRPPESSEDRTAAAATLRLRAWGPMADLATRLGLPAHGPLSLPGHWTIT
ncbi:MAG: signal peptide peptidase SppA [Streptosporangiales bacterium]|nr:signal peptide peptidase SppA [Streptosporangiales bacterium]